MRRLLALAILAAVTVAVLGDVMWDAGNNDSGKACHKGNILGSIWVRVKDAVN